MRKAGNKQSFFAVCVVLLAVFSSAPVVAADYVEEYRQYNEALAVGDQAAATAHALAAWKSAEAALGDHRTTAILAYNYGQQVLFEAPSEALPALQRAKQLLDAGVAELPAGDLRLYLAFAEFRANGETAARANNIRRAAEARDASGAPASVESSRIWLELAVFDINSFKYKLAAESAARAEESLNIAAPQDYRARAQAIMLQGAAALLPINRFISSIETAHGHFERGASLFPLQKDIDSYDPLLAALMAWDTAARAAIRSGRSDYKAKQILEDWSEVPVHIEREASRPDCAIDWKKRIPPDYPDIADQRNYIGAAVVGYHFTDDGTVTGARILAEVPGVVFGEAALKSMKYWQVQDPSSIDPACKNDLLATFSFSFR